MKSIVILLAISIFAICLHPITASYNDVIAPSEEFFEVERRFNKLPKFRGEPVRFGKRAYREPIRFGKRASYGEQTRSALDRTSAFDGNMN